jgi:hypothetical protein
VQNKDKYQSLCRHIEWLQALAADVAKMGPGKISYEAMEAIDRKYRDDFIRFHDECCAPGILNIDYRTFLEKHGVDCGRDLETDDIKRADLPLLISLLTLRIRHLYWDSHIETWVDDGVRGIYLAILLRLRELTGN